MKVRRSSRFRYITKDKSHLFLVTLILLATGMYAIFSATSPLSLKMFGDQYHLTARHAISVIAGITVMVVVSKIHYKKWSDFSVLLYFFTLALLVLVFIPGVGVRVLGASRWINFGFTSVQPSELAKLSIILYFASLSQKRKSIESYIAPTVITCLLIIIEPDLGTTVTIAAISAILMFISGVDIKKMFLISMLMGLIGFVFVVSSGYRRDRINTFLGHDQDTLGKSYHINQILYALGSGGMFGVGMGASRQKYLYLPETATDSVFPIFAEELGFVGAILLVGLLFYYIFRLTIIALSAPDVFSVIIVSGLAAWVSVQTIFNIGSMVALLPLTGIPLPFISYGGTSIVSLCFATGIAINIEKNAKK